MAKTQKPKQEQKTYNISPRVTTPSLDLYQKYKKDKAHQFTSLFVRTYASTEEVDRLIEVLDPDEYAYIVHDKDVFKDGKPKETHIHLLMYKKSQMRLTKLLSFTEQATRVEIPRSKKYAYEYLTHKNDADKVKYPTDAIHEFHKGDDTFSVTAQEARENRNMSMLDDIATLSRRQMAEKYGADYIKNYQRYEAFMEVVKAEDRLQECDTLCKEASPNEEFYHMADRSGDEIRLTLADYVCVQLREMMEGFTMPTANEIVKMYHFVLQEARNRRHEMSRALRYNETEIEVADL